jgi:rare lipoprotein A
MRLPVNLSLPLAALVLLGGCAGGGDRELASAGPLATTGPAADYPVVLGAPYVIDGVSYSPSDAMNSDAVGYAVAGGEGGDAISIAHKTLPLPSYAEVTSLDSGKTILVRVERRGPMTNERLVELSPGAAAQLGLTGTVKAPVRIRRVNPPELERAALRTGGRAPDRMDTPNSLLTVLKRKLDPALVPVATPSPVPTATPEPVATPSPTPAPKSKWQRKPRATKPIAQMPSVISPPAPVATATPEPQPVPVYIPNGQPDTAPVVWDSTSMPVVQPLPGVDSADTGSGAVVQPLPADSTPSRSTARNGRGPIVQVGAFAEKQNAYAAAAKLGASIRESGRLSRVVMGPFANWAEARAALAKAKQAGYSDARIQSGR